MRKGDRGLIGEIERGALDERTPIGAVLRKCLMLGGKAGSEELRTWATRELQGYGPDDELPGYRVIPAVIKVDFTNVRFHVTGQRISPHNLPDVVREHVDETLHLRMGIGEIEALARRPDDDKGLRFSLPGGADIATLMNHEIGEPYQHIQEVYWSVSPISLRGVIDQVRTTLTALVAELVATMPDDQDIPSSAVAANAVNVAVHGRRSRPVACERDLSRKVVCVSVDVTLDHRQGPHACPRGPVRLPGLPAVVCLLSSPPSRWWPGSLRRGRAPRRLAWVV
jgi:hypothetical protein